MVIYNKYGVQLEQTGVGQYLIGTDELGPIMWIKFPWIYQPLKDDEFLRALHYVVAVRTGKATIKKRK